MSVYYYVNKQSGYNDNHVVHASGCRYLPGLNDRQFLGSFYRATAAIQQAKKYYAGAIGCESCCPATVKKNLTPQNRVALRHSIHL
jgi:hypothetical protein